MQCNAEWGQKILKISSIKNYALPCVYAWRGFHVYGLSNLKPFCEKNTMPSFMPLQVLLTARIMSLMQVNCPRKFNC